MVKGLTCYLFHLIANLSFKANQESATDANLSQVEGIVKSDFCWNTWLGHEVSMLILNAQLMWNSRGRPAEVFMHGLVKPNRVD